MLTCQKAAEMLFEFVEEGLTPQLRDQMKKHLGCCKPCDHLYQTYAKTRSMCRELDLGKVPEQACEKVLASLRKLHQRVR